MDDVCGALARAFFTGESQCGRFKGELLTTYMQLEEQVFFSKRKAASGRDGGQAKRKAKSQADVEANVQAKCEANAEPNTNTIKKEKRNKKESGSTAQATEFVICPQCHSETELMGSLAHCPQCDITWRVEE